MATVNQRWPVFFLGGVIVTSLGSLACPSYPVKCFDDSECMWTSQVCRDGACVATGAGINSSGNGGTGGGTTSGGGGASSGSGSSSGNQPNPATNHPWANGSLVAPDATAEDQFGFSVDLQSGDRTVVGAPRHGAGRVYVFDSRGDVAVLESPTPVAGGQFGASVSLYNDKLAVGAPGEGMLEEGRVHIFTVSSGDWSRVATLGCDPECRGDRVGTTVSLDSYASDQRTFLAAGAPGYGVPMAGAGRVLLWTMDPPMPPDPNVPAAGRWRAHDPVSSATPALNGAFGSALEVNVDGYDEHWLVVGAKGEANGGAAHVFGHTAVETTWPLVATLRGEDTVDGDAFGHAVSFDQGHVLVGAPNHNVLGNQGAGAAYLFIRVDMAFNPVLTITSPTASAGERAGFSVSLNGQRSLLVGVPSKDQDKTDKGTVLVWKNNFTEFEFVRVDSGSPGPDDFGFAVRGGYTSYVCSAAMVGVEGLSGAVVLRGDP
jgi:hypothetical protein